MKADKGRSDYPYLFARLFLSHFSFVPHSTQELSINLNKSIQGPTRWLRGWSSWGQAMRTRFVHNREDTALENQVLACQRIWRRHQENITSSLLGYIARGKEKRNKLKQRRFQLFCYIEQPFSSEDCHTVERPAHRCCPLSILTGFQSSPNPWAVWPEFSVYSATDKRFI